MRCSAPGVCIHAEPPCGFRRRASCRRGTLLLVFPESLPAMVCWNPCGICLGDMAGLVVRPRAADVYDGGDPLSLSAGDAGIGRTLHRYGDYPTGRRETMRFRSRILACVGAVLLLACANGQQSYAQDTVEERHPRLELGVGGWVSWGETRWAHDASVIPGLGNPTSKLTYKDHGTNILELTGRLWVTQRFFGRLNVGGAAIGG